MDFSELVYIFWATLLHKIKAWWAYRTHPVFQKRGQHDAIVARVRGDVKQRNGRPLSMKRSNASSHCTRTQEYKNACHLVDVSDLDCILDIDTVNECMTVQPLCRMDRITETLALYGFSLPVTPEFKGITIGGTLAGGGLESSSFRYGMVQESVLEYDLVLGNGDLITVSPTKHADLFYGSMWSLGTTGIVVRVKTKIIPAMPYVHLSYQYFEERSEFVKTLGAACERDDIDFLEGVQLDFNTSVLIYGKRVATPPARVDKYRNSLWFHQWFIDHLEERNVDAWMDLHDYLFRWDRGVYWNARRKITPTFWKRMLFGWLFDMETSHTASRMKSDHSNESKRILTDVGPPLSQLQRLLDYQETHIGLREVWCLPFRLFQHEESIFSCEKTIQESICIDVGIYGVPKTADGGVRTFDAVEMNQELEAFVHDECRGMKGFETPCYYQDFEHFGSYFDLEKYDTLRKKYHAHSAFPHVFSKIEHSF